MSEAGLESFAMPPAGTARFAGLRPEWRHHLRSTMLYSDALLRARRMCFGILHHEIVSVRSELRHQAQQLRYLVVGSRRRA